MMKLKRKPRLSDLLIAQAGPFASASYDLFSKRSIGILQVAKRFVLDHQATVYLAEMIRDNPGLIADAQDFAIPPYEKMWIELPFRPFFETITGRVSDATADETVGYLFDGPAVGVAAADIAGDAEILPIRYILNRPLSLNQEIRLCDKIGTSRGQLDQFYWGESAPTLLKDGLAADLRSLRANHSFELIDAGRPFEELYETLLGGSAGDLRNIIALLLFLNRTADIRDVKDYPHSSGFINKKLSVFQSHHVISLKLNPSSRFRKLTLTNDPSYHVRKHDVRGHFCHDKRARFSGCMHGVTEDGDSTLWNEYEPLRWRCSSCGGHRSWRHEHSRGSDDGLVTKEYAVRR